jgi:hypothetical protein
VPHQPAQREHGRPLVDHGTELELLGRHEAARSEHPAHVVVQVDGHPAGSGQHHVEVDQDVEDALQPLRRQVREALVRRRRVLALVGRHVDELSGGRLEDQRRAGRGLDHVAQARLCGLGARAGDLDGVALQRLAVHQVDVLAIGGPEGEQRGRPTPRQSVGATGLPDLVAARAVDGVRRVEACAQELDELRHLLDGQPERPCADVVAPQRQHDQVGVVVPRHPQRALGTAGVEEDLPARR